MQTKLAPGCQIAYAFCEIENRGEQFQIETLRACMESAPTYPHTWTQQEGRDYVAAFLNRPAFK